MPIQAQESFPHTELEWRTIPTEHFFVHFHNGNERTAREVASIAESVYGPVTDLYAYRPEQKVHFVLLDYDDYSNGAAYFYDNKIQIWVPALDFELRGTHPWLQNVVTHEFTHIVQMQASMKWTRRVPAVYLQWLGYEAERRPDVLYGYPNVIVSYPVSGFVVPSWFAEGTAQYNHPDLRYDLWDTHRDMILRMHILEGRPLTWEQMAVFGKTSLGNESSYNAGFSIVQYIAGAYGDTAVVRIAKALGSAARVTIDGAVQDVLGISGQQLYDTWMAAKRVQYDSVRVSIAQTRTEGTLIAPDGFGNFHPVFSKDGSKIYYVSNAGEDFLSLSSIVEYDRATKKSKTIAPLVRSALSLSPDGRYLYYARITRDNPHWSAISDIYRYDLVDDDEQRLTHGQRAFSPSISPDGRRIAYTTGHDGTMNLATCDADGGNVRRLTNFAEGEQVYDPSWSTDAASIAFGFSRGHGRSIVIVDSSGFGMRSLQVSGDARDPAFSPDGNWLYFAWDTTGRFNIYRKNTRTGSIEQVTQVLGGAFQPSVDSTGSVAFARYDASGYKIALLESPGMQPPKAVFQSAPSPTVGNSWNNGLSRESSPAPVAATSHADSSRPYRSSFSSLSLIPLLRVDNYNTKNSGIDIVKLGLYFVSSEMLDKISMFGGAAINRRLERDLFLIFQFRDRLPLFSLAGLEPTLSLELYNITRVTNSSFSVFTDREYERLAEVTYSLLEFDATLRFPVLSQHTSATFGFTSSRYSADIRSEPFRDSSFRIIQFSSFRNVYLLGTSLWLQLTQRYIHQTVDEAINPVGRTAAFRVTSEFNRYNRDFDYDFSTGVPVPLYKRFNFTRWEVQWNEHVRLPLERHTFNVSLRGGTITGGTADTIFHFYGGGLIGLKGYPFYAIEGTRVAQLGAAYRFPLWTSIDTRIAQFFFTKLYASVFADIGDAWTGPIDRASWKRDAGIELRLEAFSFYAYPTRISIAGAYGFDKFTRNIQGVAVTYGKEWRFYLGVLFDFDISEMGRLGRMNGGVRGDGR